VFYSLIATRHQPAEDLETAEEPGLQLAGAKG